MRPALSQKGVGSRVRALPPETPPLQQVEAGAGALELQVVQPVSKLHCHRLPRGVAGSNSPKKPANLRGMGWICFLGNLENQITQRVLKMRDAQVPGLSAKSLVKKETQVT